ncbi:hypothetical protein ABEW32_13075 [Paenibacillus jamilae]|uniref:hypothetical protein n=1 Tax=Paenibacillus jamilae TaxID=114136 RepID=UPI003D282938
MSLTLAQPSTLQTTQLCIGSMAIIQYDHRQFPNPEQYQHHCCGLLTMSSNGAQGLAEYKLPEIKGTFDLVRWASVFTSLKGLSLTEAEQYIKQHADHWGPVKTELALSALSDLTVHANSYTLSPTAIILPPRISRAYLIEHGLVYYSF